MRRSRFELWIVLLLPCGLGTVAVAPPALALAALCVALLLAVGLYIGGHRAP